MPAPLAPLLAIQTLDLEADAARKQSESHPARAAIPEILTAIAGLERQAEASAAERAHFEAEEERLGSAVAEVAREIEAAEVAHYSLYGGLTEAEISAALEIPKSTVGNDLRFVRAWLQNRLEESVA